MFKDEVPEGEGRTVSKARDWSKHALGLLPYQVEERVEDKWVVRQTLWREGEAVDALEHRVENMLSNHNLQDALSHWRLRFMTRPRPRVWNVYGRWMDYYGGE